MSEVPRLSRLELKPAVVSYDHLDGNTARRIDVHFLDFVVDGIPLRTLASPAAANNVTTLARPWLDHLDHGVAELLGRRAFEGLPAGRLGLLVCCLCGDPQCGALTARLDVDTDEVSWSDWRWSSSLGDHPADELTEPIRFDRTAYERQLASAPRRVAAMPDDRLAYHRRRLRWPWQWG